MAYDSRDGQGARILIPGPAPLHKPLITPCGQYVVFSDGEAGTVKIIDWQGSAQRELTSGLALAVWHDAPDNRTWVYVARKPSAARGNAYEQVVRVALDEPTREEPVWDQAPAGRDNFQLSADGLRAAGMFPWPDCGIADLEAGTWERHGRGCWTAMAPDRSYRMWILDGAHRALTIVSPRDEQRWTVPLADAPGIRGYEVYHPRWSNHPRFMVITGPYKIRHGGNNIRGGGPDVEVHIGRFSPDRRSIESWVRVSDNEYANFFPDLWVDPAALPAEAPAEPEREPDQAPEVRWPAVRDRLVFLWRNRKADNRVATPDGGRRDRDPRPVDRARYGRHLEMDLRRGYFIEPEAGRDLVESAGETGAFTFEAWLTPAGKPDRAATIWALGGEDPAGAALRVEDGGLGLRWRGEGRTGEAEFLALAGWEETDAPRHLAVVLGEGRAAVYLNGALAGQSPLPPPHPSLWKSEAFYFGGTGEAETNWPGLMEGVALHGRALAPEEVARQAAAWRAGVKGRDGGRTVTVLAELTEASRIPSPEDIVPYERGLVLNEYRVLEVLEGELGEEEILAAHWVIMDGRTLETARREVGGRYRMRLELYDDRPELEGERLSMDTENILLDTYYDIDS